MVNIQDAAHWLRISDRHLRRLIKMGAIPAEKKRVEKVIEVNEWVISDEVAEAAAEELRELGQYDHFGGWMVDKAEELGVTMQDLSKRAQVPLHDLEYISSQPGWLKAEAEDIEQKIASALLRVAIQRRSSDVER